VIEVETMIIRAPFNDLYIFAEMLANKPLFHIWLGQFYLVWIAVFCMIGHRIYTAVKRFRARGKQDVVP